MIKYYRALITILCLMNLYSLSMNNETKVLPVNLVDEAKLLFVNPSNRSEAWDNDLNDYFNLSADSAKDNAPCCISGRVGCIVMKLYQEFTMKF